MNKEQMESMLDDWIADHAGEMEDLLIDRETICYNPDIGLWCCEAHDHKHTYTMVACNGDIYIEYHGTR
jgi:hypothetical protein